MARNGGPTTILITNGALVRNVCIGVCQAGNSIARKVSCCIGKPSGAAGNLMRHFHFQYTFTHRCGSTGKACKKLVAISCIKNAGAADIERWGRCEVHCGQRYKTAMAEVTGLACARNPYLYERRRAEYFRYGGITSFKGYCMFANCSVFACLFADHPRAKQ